MFEDNYKSRYSSAQKQRIVERLVVEGAHSHGWSPLKTYRAIKARQMIVSPAFMDWDDQYPCYFWEYNGISEADLRPDKLSISEKIKRRILTIFKS